MLRATGKTVLVALIAGLAACSDGAVSPKSSATQNSTGNGALATLTRTDTVRFSFVVNPASSSSFYLGAGNSVHFPAGAVCDPGSTYGTSEWDNDCTPATAPITINASAWLDPVTGNPRVDFANHLRFVPSADPLHWVTLAFTDASAAMNPSSDILYCTTAYSQCVSELSGDATLITVKNPVTGLVTRRIKHFSGYLLGSGDDCDTCTEGGAFNRAVTPMQLPPVSNTAVTTPSVASSASANLKIRGGMGLGSLQMQRRSGYMFATGDDCANCTESSTPDDSQLSVNFSRSVAGTPGFGTKLLGSLPVVPTP